MKITPPPPVPTVWHARAIFATQAVATATPTTLLFNLGTLYQDTHGFLDLANEQVVFPEDGVYFGMARITHSAGQAGTMFFVCSTDSAEFDEHMTYVDRRASPSQQNPRLLLPFGPRFMRGGETMAWELTHTFGVSKNVTFAVEVSMCPRA